MVTGEVSAYASDDCPFRLLIVPGTMLAFYEAYEQEELY